MRIPSLCHLETHLLIKSEICLIVNFPQPLWLTLLRASCGASPRAALLKIWISGGQKCASRAWLQPQSTVTRCCVSVFGFPLWLSCLCESHLAPSGHKWCSALVCQQLALHTKDRRCKSLPGEAATLQTLQTLLVCTAIVEESHCMQTEVQQLNAEGFFFAFLYPFCLYVLLSSLWVVI